MYVPELETLDQLEGGDLPVSVIRDLFPDDDRFVRAISAMLAAGEVRLLGTDGLEAPKWQWQGLLVKDVGSARLVITEIGIRRIA